MLDAKKLAYPEGIVGYPGVFLGSGGFNGSAVHLEVVEGEDAQGAGIIECAH